VNQPVASTVADMTELEDGVWLISGVPEARQVLADAATFRAAQLSEYVPGRSRSFFLAADVLGAGETSRIRASLAAAISPLRISDFTGQVLAPLAGAVAGTLPYDEPFDLMDAFIRRYSRRASYALAGLEADTAVELVARLQTASRLRAEGRDRRLIARLVHEVHQIIRQLGEDDRVSPLGIPGHALARGIVGLDELPLLMVPVLDMAASDKSSDLTVVAVGAVAGMPAPEQRGLVDSALARSAVWEAARGLEDIVVTRVVSTPVSLGGHHLPAGTRLLLDISAANQRCPVAGQELDGAHLAFGHGAHRCLGQELALAIAVTAVRALMSRGYLVRVPVPGCREPDLGHPGSGAGHGVPGPDYPERGPDRLILRPHAAGE
jgi:cytochrome P450